MCAADNGKDAGLLSLEVDLHDVAALQYERYVYTLDLGRVMCAIDPDELKGDLVTFVYNNLTRRPYISRELPPAALIGLSDHITTACRQRLSRKGLLVHVDSATRLDRGNGEETFRPLRLGGRDGGGFGDQTRSEERYR